MENLWLLNIVSVFSQHLGKENMSAGTVSWRIQVEEVRGERKVLWFWVRRTVLEKFLKLNSEMFWIKENWPERRQSSVTENHKWPLPVCPLRTQVQNIKLLVTYLCLFGQCNRVDSQLQ